MKPIYYLIILFTLWSCSKSNPEKDVNSGMEEFVFGEGEGYAIFPEGPNIKSQYVIRDGKLFEVNFVNGRGTEKQLNTEKTKIGNLLRSFPIPVYLWESQNIQVFGCNACGNLKAYYLHFERGEDSYLWSFDQNINELPTEIQEYVKKIKGTIDMIK